MTKRKLNDLPAKALARDLAAATRSPRERPPVRKAGASWTPNEQRAADLNGRQVRCLTADAGHLCRNCFDRLPRFVRRRLAKAPSTCARRASV